MVAATDSIPTAGELVAAYSAGEYSPVEATRAAYERIRERNPGVNAYCLLDEAAAMESAEESARRWEHGHPLGLLDGVPTSVTDMFFTRGWPTRRGSRAVSGDGEWQEDSPAVARLREHGAVLLGKTATSEIGWQAVTDSPLTGVTRNPWNSELTAGGSSGGSAAAVASGMGALALGTDGAGSLRIPAAFCGVTGFKPTYGRVPLYPSSPFGTLSHAGPVAWSVDDIALAMDVLTLPDPRDPSALAPPMGSYREAVRRDVRGLVAAFSEDLGYVDVDPEVAGIVAEAVTALGDAGLHVERADPDIADSSEAFDVLWSARAARWLDTLDPAATSAVDPGLLALWERGSRLSASDYLSANDARVDLGVQMGMFHSRYDVLLVPAVAVAPFEAGREVPVGSPYRQWPEWAALSYPFNLTQQPAAVVPAGLTGDGRPVGLQVVGPRHSDDLVLAVCRMVESARPWHANRPAAV